MDSWQSVWVWLMWRSMYKRGFAAGFAMVETGSMKSISRRKLLQMGTGVAAAIYLGSDVGEVMPSDTPSAKVSPAAFPATSKIPKAPNIIVLMTDQERHHMHWPAGWTEKHLPSLQRLKRNGLYFKRAYTAATQCSPSRALMMSGRFAPTNRVTQTFIWPGLPYKNRVATSPHCSRTRPVTRPSGRASGT
jgi:Sulfatase